MYYEKYKGEHKKLMENPDVLALVTISVAMLSLVGNLLQYVFSPKNPKTNAELEVAQTLKTITEAYDSLFSNLRLEIEGYEEEQKLQVQVIEELRKVKVVLEKKIEKQEEQLKKQGEQLEVLRTELHVLRKEYTEKA